MPFDEYKFIYFILGTFIYIRYIYYVSSYT